MVFGSAVVTRTAQPENAVTRTIRLEASRRLVIAAIALKRFQLSHGAWPGKLGDLVPAYLPSVPVDPYDGAPLKYHPNEDGTCALYSVGEDGKDDGGDPTNDPASASGYIYWFGPHVRDWVWPQPASAAEVKFFYENSPK